MKGQILPDRYGEDCKGSIGYWENLGQLHDQQYLPVENVRFYSQGGYPLVYLQKKSKFSLVVKEPTLPPSGQVYNHRIDVRPYQSNNVDPDGNTQKLHHQNFYLPWTEPEGATQVYGYDRVVYADIYQDIDMVFYSGSAGQKLAFYCWPGCDPSKLTLQFFGQDSLKVDLDGDLKVWFSGRWIELKEATAYQVGTNNQVIPLNWSATYQEVNGDDLINFAFETYNPSLPLVLQVGALPIEMATDTPGLCWSAYFGGSGLDDVKASTIDVNGNYYVTGSSSSDFTTFQDFVGTDLVGLNSAVILAKFQPDHSLEWMVFYGGTTNQFEIFSNQYGNAVVTRQSGGQTQIFVGGTTKANNIFPAPLSGAYNVGTGTGTDFKGFIARFRGDGLIQWSTYFGNDGGEQVEGLDVDAQGRLHIVGTCNSSFPSQPLTGAYNVGDAGGSAGIMVARFNADCSLNWCGSIGGSGVDEGADIVCHPNGFYVSGSTSSTNFPVIGGGEDYHAGGDVVLLDFNSAADVIWCSHHGGSDWDQPGINSLAKDNYNNLVVAGATESSDMVLLSAGGFFKTIAECSAGFIARYANNSHALQWCTYVCGAAESANNAGGKLVVAGATSNTSFSIVPVGAYYNQGTINNLSDGYLMMFNDNTQLAYSTFFGGIQGVYPENIYTTTYGNGSIYFAGRTSKPIEAPNSFFPLDDAGGPPAYFDESYDPAPTNFLDLFLAAICVELNVGMDDVSQTSVSFALIPIASREWMLLGLPSGIRRLDLFDSKGALVHQASIAIDPQGRGLLQMPELSPGLYTCRAVGQGAVKFMVEQR